MNYCEKDGDFVTVNKACQGARTDVHAVCELLQGGANVAQVAATFPTTFLRLHRGIAAYHSILQLPHCGKPRVVWLYGPTGTGKSRISMTLARAYSATSSATTHGTSEIWRATECLKYFYAYQGQKIVIFDDFRDSWCPYSYLLNLFDYGPMYVHTMGNCVAWMAEYIWVTCNKSPIEIYPGVHEGRDQLLRRLDEVYEITENNLIKHK